MSDRCLSIASKYWVFTLTIVPIIYVKRWWWKWNFSILYMVISHMVVVWRLFANPITITNGFLFVFFCSDGGGRSGVYLAIDANMELAEEEDCFHVYGYLKKLRLSRKGLIENVVCLNISNFQFLFVVKCKLL